jgi:uncharacterized repeat protein (TIGR03803 family)
VDGTFYGTTEKGGVNGVGCRVGGCGTVYSVTPAGVEKVLYSFRGGKNGFYPFAGLIRVGNKLYGTSNSIFSCHPGTPRADCGTVYSVTLSGAHKVLHVFQGASDGAFPFGGLINVGGTLYGTTELGGSALNNGEGDGTVFSITPQGVEKVVYVFHGLDGAAPLGSLINVGGTLYGTTSGGGSASCCGTVFSVTPAGAENVLYSFQGGSDGAIPWAGLIDVGGELYGTTTGGGLVNCYNGAESCGTVFEVSPTTGIESVRYAFKGGADGGQPQASLIDVGGIFYGSAPGGGSGGTGGTVFSLTKQGVETVLHNFTVNTSDGEDPESNLINVDGTLYGTTYYGGAAVGPGGGTVYWVKP